MSHTRCFKDSLLLVSPIWSSTVVPCEANCSFFPLILCSLGKLKLVIILYLQCGFRAISFRFIDTVDWTLFAGFFFIFYYQYPLEYNFKASLSSVWYAGVGVGSQPEMCSDDL